jgi:L-carnitine CoA-transferase
MDLAKEKPSFGVLDGVRVLYSAVEIAAPTAACIMGEWGADVTQIENTGAGDTMRDTAWIKQLERRNQRSIQLNPFTDKGRDVLMRILKDTDIFIESSKGPAWAKHGVTDELMWQANPKLVIVHVSGFGQDGDPAVFNRAAYDLTTCAYSGYMSQNGFPDQPVNPGPYAADYINSLMMVGASLAALRKAEQTGKGESVDLAMFETLLRIGAYYLVDYVNAGIKWPRPGARNQNLCAIGEYQCSDGFIGLTVYGVKQNKYLLEAIGLGDLWGTEDIPDDSSALWLSNPHAKEIEEHLEAYCLKHTRKEIEDEFSANRIAAQSVLEFEDMVKEEHLKLRGDWQEWQTAEGDTFKGIGIFPKFKNNPGQTWRPMPPLGYDTRDVLVKAGLNEAEISDLAAEGVVKLGD